MKAIELQDAFGLEQLKRVDRPEPEAPGPGQVRLKMRAASLNYRDLLTVIGQYNPRQPLPLVPLSDGAGEVVEVGEGITRVQVGDRVTPTFAQGWLSGTATANARHQTLGGPLDGTLVETMTLHEDGVVRMPEHLSFIEAATLPCAAVTAWNAVIEQADLKPGSTVAVQGTGGVALFALQFAKAVGASVVITSSSDEKLERCRVLGADHTINYGTHPDWGKDVRRWSGGGVDLVIELGGSETLAQSLRAVRPSGQISMIGVLSGSEAALRLPLVVMQNLRLQGIMVGSRAVHEAMVRAMEQHRIRPVLDRTFAFDDVREALEHLQAGRHFGKITIAHSE